MTIEEILQQHAPCYITFKDNSGVYCRGLKAGDLPDKGPTVRIEDADGNVRYFSADSVLEIRNVPPLPW